MKRLLCAVAVLALLASSAVAQEPMLWKGKVGAFFGYGQSSFEKDWFWDEDTFGDVEAGDYAPVGVQAMYQVMPKLFVGAEINFSALKFTWELQANGVKLAEIKVSQNVFGLIAKCEFGQGKLKPLARLGLGMYTGGLEWCPEPEAAQYGFSTEEADEDYKSAFGFNIGGGVTGRLGERMYWLAEGVYHIVGRKADREGAESYGHNNAAVQLGVGMMF